MKPFAIVALAVLLSGCTANNYAHENFDMMPAVNFTDPNTKQGYSIRDKPFENRLKMMLDAGSSVNMALFGGRNAIPPMPFYEEAAVKYLATTGRTCAVTRSFEIIPSEIEIQYACEAPAAQ